MHVPQSLEAQVELEDIAAIPYHIITPRHAKPLIGVYQDTLVGSYRLTRPSVNFTKREFMNLMMWNTRFDGEMPASRADNNRYTGQQVLSALLPSVNIEMGNKSYDGEKDSKESANYVKIVQGDIKQGIIDDDIYMKPGKGIIHTTYNDYGPKETTQLLDALQNTVESFLVMNGFSVGISDLVADEDTKKNIDEVIQAQKKQVENLTLQVHTDLFENNTGKTNQQEFEDQVFGILNQATDNAGKAGKKSLSTENRLLAMVNSGSKGNTTNVAQMIACLGQQAIEGKRIQYGFTDRTLPHYKKYDDGAEARGFIESSFIRGLTPQEFFFHAMSGREGLIDTAVKTAETGYIQRQLIKAMEDLVVQHDGTVRDANMNLMQFHYGEDGIMATKVENQSLPLGKLSQEDIRREFSMEGLDWSTILEDGTSRDADIDIINSYVEKVLADQRMIVEDVFRSSALESGNVTAPVNLARMILNIKVRFGLQPTSKTTLIPSYVLTNIDNIIRRTSNYHHIWTSLLRYYLAPHRIIVKERFTKNAFDALCELIVVQHMKSWVQPGEQVGIVAAQSIGEPSTQMSAIGSTVICVTNGKDLRFYGSIKDFIDPILEKNKEKVIEIASDSSVLSLDDDYYIVGVSNDEKTSWKRISEISRHPANGGLVKVTTRSGRSTTATLSHSFLKRSKTGIVPVLGSELKVGMRIPVAREITEVPGALTEITQGSTIFTLDKEFGWVCGIYLADGSFSGNTVKISKINPIVEEKLVEFAKKYSITFSKREYEGEYGPSKDNNLYSKDLKDFLLTTFKTGSYEKEIGSIVFHSNKEFIAGIISGYFDGDGNISVEKQLIRASSRSEKLIDQICALLGYCGLFGIISEETSIRIKDKVQHTLCIPRKFARSYKETIGFEITEKADALDKIIKYNERDDVHDRAEYIDKIPELGEIIAETGKLLKMPGQSRTYGRWIKKESIGRRTLEQYVENFKEEALVAKVDSTSLEIINNNIKVLESAINADVVWDEIVNLEYLEDPKEYVYDFTVPGNDSFMVDCNVLVHNTLNSVDWNTEIIIAKNGKIMTPKIGEFIDTYYKECDKSKVQYLQNDQIYIPLEDGNDWKAISCNEDGKMMWTKLEAITRHPVINEDGTNTIIEVELESGRKVKATKAHSFLTLIDGKVKDIKGSELTIGGVLPLTMDMALDQLTTIDTLNLRDILKPSEWLYESEAKKAVEAMNSGVRTWFNNGQGKEFTVPYSRSDAFRDAFVNGHNTSVASMRSNCIYPKHGHLCKAHIPESISLDKDFGFFVGAYLAEGMSNSTQVNITNNDKTYMENTIAILDKWNVGYHIVKADKHSEKTNITGTTTSLIAHSTVLAKVMSTLFGRVSYEKTIPDWVFQAPTEFVSGLIDGYVSGDGTVSKKSTIVAVTSVSENLLTRFGTLLSRYGIHSMISSHMPEKGVFDSVVRNYTLTISSAYAKKFAETFTLSVDYKQEALNKFVDRRVNNKYSTTGQVFWDKIVAITECEPLYNRVYDLTVEHTKNFVALNTIALRDTFHLAGVASKSNVTRGVPRLKELLKVSKNPKATSLTIYLKAEYRESKDKAREVVQDLELTLLRSITDRIAIYWDPKDESTVIEEDKELLEFFRLYEIGLEEDESNKVDSKWVLRLELNKEEMFNKNISMADVVYIINQKYPGNSIIYSDYNSDKLVIRIRVQTESINSANVMDEFTNLKKFQNNLLNTTVIRGIPGIKAVTFRKDKDKVQMIEGKYEPIEQYILDTDGSNYVCVMNHPAVDASKLYTTNVHDIVDILGLEATRAILYNEMATLFESVSVNYRHLGLLCDVITRSGRLMSIDRYGINKNDIGPLAKASFEETEKIMLKAARFGEIDPVTGVSANIMMGQPIRGGTAFSQIMLDESVLVKLLQGSTEQEDAEEEEIGDIGDLLADGLNIADPCNATQFQMNMTMPPLVNALEEPDIEISIIGAK